MGRRQTRRIGAAVRARRMQLGLSQVFVARAVGMSQQALCDIEKGRYNPSLEVMPRLAAALQVRVEDLLTDSA